MEAVSSSETSVNFYRASWRNSPEDSHIHLRRRENLKSHVRIYYRMIIKVNLWSLMCTYKVANNRINNNNQWYL
jgi:hypothetical protein